MDKEKLDVSKLLRPSTVKHWIDCKSNAYLVSKFGIKKPSSIYAERGTNLHKIVENLAKVFISDKSSICKKPKGFVELQEYCKSKDYKEKDLLNVFKNIAINNNEYFKHLKDNIFNEAIRSFVLASTDIITIDILKNKHIVEFYNIVSGEIERSYFFTETTWEYNSQEIKSMFPNFDYSKSVFKGTVDVIYIKDGFVEIIDYKFGDIEVYPNNPQLLVYHYLVWINNYQQVMKYLKKLNKNSHYKIKSTIIQKGVKKTILDSNYINIFKNKKHPSNKQQKDKDHYSFLDFDNDFLNSSYLDNLINLKEENAKDLYFHKKRCNFCPAYLYCKNIINYLPPKRYE